MAPAVLYKPQQAIRVRWNMNPDTPIPQEEAAGQNPPDGAIIDYYLKEKSTSEVTLEIFDASGRSVRKYSSNDKPYTIPDVNIPLYWIRPQQILSAEAGSHRFLWDLHYKPLEETPSYPIAAVYMNTAPEPSSPWAAPGSYTVKLSVNGTSYTQTFSIKMDPRVKTSVADLQKLSQLSLQCYDARVAAKATMTEINMVRKQIKDLLPNAAALAALDQKAAALEGTSSRRGRGGAGNGAQGPSFGGLESTLGGISAILHETDMPPTSQAVNAATQTLTQLKELQTQWNQLKTEIQSAQKNTQK
jgi:hypothetical protein